MSNQLAKLDFWNFRNYLNSDQSITDLVETNDYVNKSSKGYLSVSIQSDNTSSYGIKTFYSLTPTTRMGETLCKQGTYYRGACFGNNLTYVYVNSAGLGKINESGVKGFEFHFCHTSSATANYTRSNRFSIDGKSYSIQWTTNAGLLLYVDATPTAWSYSSTDITTTHATNFLWKSSKMRAYVSGGKLYIKFVSQEGAKLVIGGYVSGALSATTFSTEIRHESQNVTPAECDNHSIYRITEAQANAYAVIDDASVVSGTPTNDMLPFQRYLPVLDKVRYDGADWTDTAGTGGASDAFADLTDGNLTTHATTATTNSPIGMDSNGTLGALLGNGYYWTPGTLTALPTIGIIRSLQSSKYKLASTQSETVRTKFGDGTDEISFNTTTQAVESGETIVNTVFSNNGTFTDGVDSVVIDTATTLRSTIELV